MAQLDVEGESAVNGKEGDDGRWRYVAQLWQLVRVECSVVGSIALVVHNVQSADGNW